jgi:hypothetical protein
MAIQQWDPNNEPVRPGIYTNFKNAAAAQTIGGAQGTVAIPLKSYANTATAKTFYTVENEQQAIDLFGEANIQSIKFALQGGAKEVLVYTLPTIDGTTVTESAAYTEAREAFEARPFNVFVFDGEVSDTELTDTRAWVQQNRDEGKHFMLVVGGNATDDADPTLGNQRSTTLSDEYVVNLISGVEINGTAYSSAEFAPYIAGLIAGTPINQAITYVPVPVDDVTKRLRNSEIDTALEAGSLVLVNDGEKVKVEQGITTSKDKIRKIRARQAITTDISKMAQDYYIGRLDNKPAGQATLISAIKAYLETLENQNVLMLEGNPVRLDPNYPPNGDKVYLAIAYTEVDSMERIFLTVTV